MAGVRGSGAGVLRNSSGLAEVASYYWNTSNLAWEAVTGNPSGTSDATAANQVTGNASLSSIDTKLSSQATAANQTTGNTSLSNIDGKLGTLVDSSAPVITMNALVPKKWDYLSYTATNATTDTYVYKSGGSGGTTVATVTVTWTDSTKTVLSTVVRT
jgi:hypothetical protein